MDSCKEKGIIIYGRDIRAYMPDISIENIEIDIVDEIILFRYYEIAKSLLSKNDYKFSFIKNLNYLLTWSLIRDGILKVGFEERYKILVSNDPKNKITNSLFAEYHDIMHKNIQSRYGKCKIPKYFVKVEDLYINQTSKGDFLTTTFGSSKPVGLSICSITTPLQNSNSESDGVADTNKV